MTASQASGFARKPMTGPGVVVRLIVAWLFVGVPLAWGVYRTYLTAKPLFEAVQAKAKV